MQAAPLPALLPQTSTTAQGQASATTTATPDKPLHFQPVAAPPPGHGERAGDRDARRGRREAKENEAEEDVTTAESSPGGAGRREGPGGQPPGPLDPAHLANGGKGGESAFVAQTLAQQSTAPTPPRTAEHPPPSRRVTNAYRASSALTPGRIGR